MTDCRTVGTIPPPPPGIEQRRALAAPGPGDPPHHWIAGPQDVAALPKPRRIRLRDGRRVPVTHAFRWYLDRVEGTDRRTAERRVYDVVLHPRGWVRAGVHWQQVYDPAEADILVRVIPQDTSVCGQGSAGCYSWSGDETPVAEMGVEHIGAEGPWRTIVGMELAAHGTFRIHDHYMNHDGYRGSVGTWESAAAFGFLPSDAEIASAREWLLGKTPLERVHEH